MVTGNIPSAVVGAVALPEKLVQELAQDDGLVPERYIYKNTSDSDPPFNSSLPIMDCPTIDLQLLGSSSESELDKFLSALTSWGCFQVVNHGISSSSLDEMRGVIKNFFELPLEEKQKYCRSVDDLEGYGNDTFVSENQALDWMDRMYLVIHPVEKCRLHLWPQNPESLRENLQQFALKMHEILKLVLKAAARSLGLEDESFLKQYGEKGTMLSRLNMYPKCPLPERVLGIHQHSDGSTITVLLQDEQVEGLQVLKDDQWFKVPVNPDALFINVGDQLGGITIMSNGILKSPIHRVATNAEKGRISLAMFCCADADNEIGPLEELITEDQPQKYRRVKNFDDIFFKNYQMGESTLSAVRI